MQIIPAIDIIEGKCVRLTEGDYAQKKIYNENPLEVAKTIAKWCNDANTFTYDVVNEETDEAFTVDLSEDDEDAVLSNKD